MNRQQTPSLSLHNFVGSHFLWGGCPLFQFIYKHTCGICAVIFLQLFLLRSYKQNVCLVVMYKVPLHKS